MIGIIDITDTVTGITETSMTFAPESQCEMERMFDLAHMDFNAMVLVLMLERKARADRREQFLTFARQDAQSREFFNSIT